MVNNGNSDIIKKMLDILYDYNFEKVDYNLQSDLLFTSIYNQDIDLVKYFLDLGADINSLNRMRDGSIGTPLMYSAFLENYDIADYLLEKNADVNINCFQDNQELENIWNYYSYYTDERDEIINNFHQLEIETDVLVALLLSCSHLLLTHYLLKNKLVDNLLDMLLHSPNQ